MKKISITGKHNINLINGNKHNEFRNVATYDEPFISEQLSLVNKYFMNIEDDNTPHLKSEITRKINGYKSQDVKKKIYNDTKLVNIDNVLEKLVTCKLKCYYCRKQVKVLFTKVRDDEQWTLDRINNDICHSNSNTVICCLKCNLQRRVKSSEDFIFTKQLKVTRV
jgi:hypothetical protein|tara:strand:+ start:159 stop:656 length:498 start_codon:yes stop_codon:yes gene_type:complete